MLKKIDVVKGILIMQNRRIGTNIVWKFLGRNSLLVCAFHYLMQRSALPLAIVMAPHEKVASVLFCLMYVVLVITFSAGLARLFHLRPLTI